MRAGFPTTRYSLRRINKLRGGGGRNWTPIHRENINFPIFFFLIRFFNIIIEEIFGICILNEYSDRNLERKLKTNEKERKKGFLREIMASTHRDLALSRILSFAFSKRGYLYVQTFPES